MADGNVSERVYNIQAEAKAALNPRKFDKLHMLVSLPLEKHFITSKYVKEKAEAGKLDKFYVGADGKEISPEALAKITSDDTDTQLLKNPKQKWLTSETDFATTNMMDGDEKTDHASRIANTCLLGIREAELQRQYDACVNLLLDSQTKKEKSDELLVTLDRDEKQKLLLYMYLLAEKIEFIQRKVLSRKKSDPRLLEARKQLYLLKMKYHLIRDTYGNPIGIEENTENDGHQQAAQALFKKNILTSERTMQDYSRYASWVNLLRLTFILRFRQAIEASINFIKNSTKAAVSDNYIRSTFLNMLTTRFLGILAFIPRLILQLIAFTRHWFGKKFAKARISTVELALGKKNRAKMQWQRRWYHLINDFTWVVVNSITALSIFNADPVSIGSAFQVSNVAAIILFFFYGFDAAMAVILGDRTKSKGKRAGNNVEMDDLASQAPTNTPTINPFTYGEPGVGTNSLRNKLKGSLDFINFSALVKDVFLITTSFVLWGGYALGIVMTGGAKLLTLPLIGTYLNFVTCLAQWFSEIALDYFKLLPQTSLSQENLPAITTKTERSSTAVPAARDEHELSHAITIQALRQNGPNQANRADSDTEEENTSSNGSPCSTPSSSSAGKEAAPSLIRDFGNSLASCFCFSSNFFQQPPVAGSLSKKHESLLTSSPTTQVH